MCLQQDWVVRVGGKSGVELLLEVGRGVVGNEGRWGQGRTHGLSKILFLTMCMLTPTNIVSYLCSHPCFDACMLDGLTHFSAGYKQEWC
jgi:hypothetical protein